MTSFENVFLLLALSTLVTPVHGVVHHAPVERIVRLLLIFVSGNDGPSDDAEGARVLGLPLLLQLGTGNEAEGEGGDGGS